ncbi:MAG TPA: hypothetical protein VG369_06655 [Humibacter sp.]|nr:hypothetical protein [Humibacter sp.]
MTAETSQTSAAAERALISGTFDDEETSRRVFDRLRDLHRAALLNVTGLVWIAVAKDGHVDMTTAPHDASAPERESDAATFAQILGSLLTTPLLGAAVSGTVDAVVDRVAEDDDTPAKSLRKKAARILTPGKWTVVAYASQVAEAAIRADLLDDAPDLAVWEIDESAAAGLADDAGVSA